MAENNMVLDKLFNSFTALSPVTDFKWAEEAQRLIDGYLQEALPDLRGRYHADAKDYDAANIILESDRELQITVVCLLTQRLIDNSNKLYSKSTISSNDPRYARDLALRDLLSKLLRRKLAYQEIHLAYIIDTFNRLKHSQFWNVPIIGIIGLIERYAATHGLSPAFEKRIAKMKKLLARDSNYAEVRKAIARIEAIFGSGEVEMVTILPGDAWANLALADLAKMELLKIEAWQDLINYTLSARASKPSNKWVNKSEDLRQNIGIEEFSRHICAWFALVGSPGNHSRPPRRADDFDANQLLLEENSNILKGLAWCCIGSDDQRLCRSLGDMAEACYKKIRHHGPRSVKVGNACLVALSRISNMEAAAQLSRLKTRLKQASAKAQIEKALDVVSEKMNLSVDELEEIAVPAFDMTEVGILRKNLDGYTAIVRITGTSAAELTWIAPNGKSQKSVPAAIKTSHPEEIKKLKKLAKDLKTTLHTQKMRIEKMFLRERVWNIKQWRERYLDHPLLAPISRRLIWHFEDGNKSAAGIWLNGEMVDVQDRPIDFLNEKTNVRLWHPIGCDVSTITDWRTWLDLHEVQQPFKQAHREVYIVTEAELQTREYSNRFAAHIIKQHQFTQLCQQRGWRYQFQGTWDSHNVPEVKIPRWGLSAQFWVEAYWDASDNSNVSENGVFLTVHTDQVRFLDSDDVLMPISDVPPLVFSEIMRDVDLFVGVCSIGNDPTWQDGGQFQNYWIHYSFGDLAESAKVRKEVLERLVPKLKIAGQCSFTAKFLVVQGSIRTYKIHLGSGNILMAPNDQYLCIVQDRSATNRQRGNQKIFLPFEGDAMLSLILSKAFLLADDHTITDRIILSQINGV